MKSRVRVMWLALFLATAACNDEPAPPQSREPRSGSADVARRDIHEAFELARAAVKHASDGGGRAWLEFDETHARAVVAGSTARFRIVFEAGPLGIAAGGALFLQVSPFFEWSTPQVESEASLGFTRVATAADGVALEPRTLDQQLLGIEIGGRALRAGEQVVIEYGAGAAGARVDPYAEAASTFWIAVDGDGDGVRKLIADSPSVEVLAGPPAMVVATLPSTRRGSEDFELTVAVLDGRANLARGIRARVEIADVPQGLELAREGAIDATQGGRTVLRGRAMADGVYRLRVSATVGERTFTCDTNPLVVGSGPRIYWADLHGHTALSDGSGTPEHYFEYAREVAALDVAALTDHDHWGMRFVDEQPELWSALVDAAQRAHRPGQFVTVPGYEWTSWLTGHRHVLFFGSEASLFSALDARFDTPDELRAALLGQAALIVPHHPAGGPIAIDWRIALDPELEPVVEICSAHGTSEALDCPRVIHAPRPGHFARDALAQGQRFGFIGSGDGHDGHPGLTWKGPHYPTGGLAAILAPDLTREGVYGALRARRTYATSGPRIVLRFALGGARMGESIDAAAAAREGHVFLQVSAVSALERIEVVVGAADVLSIPCRGELDFSATASLSNLRAGEFVYARVLQLDGGMAWSSPIFVD